MGNTCYKTCLYCGITSICDTQYNTQQDADKAATLQCSCDDAKRYQQKEKNVDNLNTSLSEVENYCGNHKCTFTNEIREHIRSIATMVIDMNYTSAKVEINSIAMTFSLNSKDQLIIKIKYTDSKKNGGNK